MVRRIGPVIIVCALVAGCGTGGSQSPTNWVAAERPAAQSSAPTTSASATSSAVVPTTTPTPASPEPTTEPTATAGAAPTATPKPTATAAAVKCLKGREVNAFAIGLVADLNRRDADVLGARMGGSFTFVIEATDVAIPAREPGRAIRELLSGLREDGFMGSGGKPLIIPLAKGARVRCVSGVPLDRATGRAILGRGYEAAFLATGWGSSRDEEAFVFLARTSSGRLVWRGIWYSVAGFER